MFDICQKATLNQGKGIIYSPGYPSHRIQNTLCVTEINVQPGSSFNIWVTDMSIKGRDTSQQYFLF